VDSIKSPTRLNETITITLLFDPLTKATFKTSVANGIMGLVNQMETQVSFQAFRSKLAARFPYNPTGNSKMKTNPIIHFEDQYVFKGGQGSIPSSVQHNVPAWSIFAMFFIIVSFSQRIIEERISGVSKRLNTMPINNKLLLFGKAITYLLISEIQVLIILILGFWFMPIIGLPALEVNGSILLLFLFTIPIAMASAGIAILVGNWSKTRDQAASFGSIIVIIMAALGGIWVPVFAMPSALQVASHFSPLYWALEGYYSIIVRGAGVSELMIPSLILIGLFTITFALSSIKRH
jgi:ABC-2 type transport system permease protein